RVLERPEIPLHTNGSENDIRACVTKRKISGGTMSEAGRIARDVMLGMNPAQRVRADPELTGPIRDHDRVGHQAVRAQA
ncbi:hypothetical protein MKK67_02925, partial [Methylobacterium sp. J-072]|nr:hypothetical protein [Methylobacterium sp. J-072]